MLKLWRFPILRRFNLGFEAWQCHIWEKTLEPITIGFAIAVGWRPLLHYCLRLRRLRLLLLLLLLQLLLLVLLLRHNFDYDEYYCDDDDDDYYYYYFF